VCGPGSHHAGLNDWLISYISRERDVLTSLAMSFDGNGGTGCRSSAARVPRVQTAGPVLEVQVFGTRKSAETRKALRFFAERRVRTHFVDFQERDPSVGELRRFAERIGAAALVDRASRRFAELGLGPSMHSDDWWLRRLSEEPFLLRMPLVRCGRHVTVGPAEAAWRAWVSSP
jgi:arsenate reductase-like glutaredoxin family protein